MRSLNMAQEYILRHFSPWLWRDRGRILNFIQHRKLTSGEVSTALRPFYFSVHPDLFGQYPSERAVNENSLKLLSSYLETIQTNRPARPTTLKFYLRPQGNVIKGSFKSVNINLAQRDVRKTVVSILSSCDLPTTYVDKIPAPEEPVKVTISKYQSYYQYDETEEDDYKIKKSTRTVKENQHLMDWLRENEESARVKAESCRAIREEVQRLQEVLKSVLGVREVVWDCGWNIAHYRGCLQAIQALAEHHLPSMGSLKGRTLVFGSDTGLSRDGDVLLNSAEVRHNWLDFIKKVHTHEEALKSLPSFEKAVSRVLRDIQIVRRKFQPKTMAKQYESCLRRMTTSLSDYQGMRGYPKQWPESLSNFELVIETEAGPLMLSPTGQFIVPCSCPAFLLVNFITENLNTSTQLLHEYKSCKEDEVRLQAECISKLGLVSLSKSDSVGPKLMISCLKSLLTRSDSLHPLLASARLHITNYYSVMSDGQICIPWNHNL